MGKVNSVSLSVEKVSKKRMQFVPGEETWASKAET